MDIGMSEMIVIGIVALIFIPPRDLPEMFRQLGRMSAKLRGMAREFSRAMEQAANESGVKDVARDLNTIANPKATGLNAVKGAMDKFEKWDPIKNAAKPGPVAAAASPARPLTPPPMPATPAPSSLTSVAARDAELPSIADELADDLEALADLEALDELEALDGVAKPPVSEAPVSAAPVSAAPVHGPHTQALYDKAALKAKVIAEQTEKLKAIEAGTYVPATPEVMDPLGNAPAASAPAANAPAPLTTTEAAPKKRSTKVASKDAPLDPAPATAKPKSSRAKPKTPDTAEAKPKKTRKTPGEETA